MLRDLIKSRKKPGVVIPVLEQQTLVEGMRDRMRRRRGVFHPSEISGAFCPREWLLCDRNRELYLKQSVGVNTQLRWDVGKALHSMVHRKLGNAGVLFGYWKCLRRCLEFECRWLGFKPSEKCEEAARRSTRPIWSFDELPVQDEDLMIEGRADGLLAVNHGKYVLEFKSIYSHGFQTLLEPMEEAKEQGLIYLDVLERTRENLERPLLELQDKGIDVEREIAFVRQSFSGVAFVYMCKDDQMMREFVVKGGTYTTREFLVSSDDPVRDALEEKKAVLRSTIDHIEAGTLPGRLDECVDKTASRARRCLARIECFDCEV